MFAFDEFFLTYLLALGFCDVACWLFVTACRTSNRLRRDGALLSGLLLFVIGACAVLLAHSEQIRHNAAPMESRNNLKQMSVAIEEYRAKHGHFPRQAIYSAEGKPLLSWRVSVLPFVEQETLYKQFHLDEPWDSPHNIKLLEMMPATYAHPKDP